MVAFISGATFLLVSFNTNHLPVASSGDKTLHNHRSLST